MLNPFCNIIGGGESLKGFDLNELEPFYFDNFGVNKSALIAPCNNVVFWDYTVLHEIRYFEGVRHTIKVNEGKYFKPGLCEVYEISQNKRGIILYDKFVPNINNSGYMAISVAAQQGYSRIYLFGYDMGWQNTPHFYDDDKIYMAGRPEKMNQSCFKDLCLPFFKEVRESADKLRIRVINVVNPDLPSNITQLEQITFSEYLQLKKSNQL